MSVLERSIIDRGFPSPVVRREEARGEYHNARLTELLQKSERVTHPTILLVNTEPWLKKLSDRFSSPITMGNIPEEALDEIADGNNIIWFMGVWKQSEAGRQNAKKYRHEYLEARPNINDNEIRSSVFSIPEYVPDVSVAPGGWNEWDSAKERINSKGLRVCVDLVPNHTALDHHWTREHPEYYIQGNDWQVRQNPGAYYAVQGQDSNTYWVAHGKDPNFAGWEDTAQLDYTNLELQAAMEQQIIEISEHADMARCDVAMLLNASTFVDRTWREHVSLERAHQLRENEFWQRAIPRVKEHARVQGREFQFLAEAYWDKASLGKVFDGIYAKGFYDDIINSVKNEPLAHEYLRAHMAHLMSSQREYNPVLFTDNHDEQRPVCVFGGREQAMAAAAITAFIPGYRMVNLGQDEGKAIRTPMQVNRFPDEPVDWEQKVFHERLSQLRESTLFQQSEIDVHYVARSHPDSTSNNRIIAQQAVMPEGDGAIICTNVSSEASDGRIFIPKGADVSVWDISKGQWLPTDEIAKPTDQGFYIRLEPWKTQAVFFTGKEKPQEVFSESGDIFTAITA